MRNSTTATAGPKASNTSGGGGPTSRRSTRSAGTRDSCSSGGSANPASTAIAVTKPMASGARLAGGSSVTAQQAADGAQQPLLREKSERRADRRGHEREREQLQHRHRQGEGTRRTERLQQRHGVEVAVDIAARCHGDRDRAQQHAHQAREAQETAGAIDGVADLRAGVGDIAQPLAGTLVWRAARS